MFSTQDAAYRQWLDSVGDEIKYWRHYLSTSGGDYPEDFAFRLRHDTLIEARDTRLAKRLALFPRDNVRLLDVGSGPLTNLGKIVDGKTVDITACDPLADIYDILIKENGLQPPVRTVFSDAENLSTFFSAHSFDVIHSANAMDHSYDPISAILEMLKVVAVDGFVYLGHFENEAEWENYSGFHQWNFTERNGDFFAWNKTTEVSISQFFHGCVSFDVERIKSEPKDWILLILRRNERTADFLKGKSVGIGYKYRASLFSNIISAMTSNDRSASSIVDALVSLQRSIDYANGESATMHFPARETFLRRILTGFVKCR